MNKKKIILISLIILDIIIFGVAVFLTIRLIKINESESNINNRIENKVNSVISNNVIENKVVNNIENNIEENKNTENNAHIHEEQIVDPEQEINMSAIQKQENNQEKAINIAKQKWGEDSSVEFTFDHIDENGRYVIFVRDIATTRQIDEYAIDIQTGEIY